MNLRITEQVQKDDAIRNNSLLQNPNLENVELLNEQSNLSPFPGCKHGCKA